MGQPQSTIAAPQLQVVLNRNSEEARVGDLSMAIIHCLWIGALAGLVASRGIRLALAPVVSTMAVGVFGALLGGLAESWSGASAESLPLSTLVLPALGATLALVGWAAARHTVLSPRANSQRKDRG
jgi:uncharacterized membrane protein YeaQ/YmgE (transglycosylase-associated protein family)